jgi:hypothetical protein
MSCAHTGANGRVCVLSRSSYSVGARVIRVLPGFEPDDSARLMIPSIQGPLVKLCGRSPLSLSETLLARPKKSILLMRDGFRQGKEAVVGPAVGLAGRETWCAPREWLAIFKMEFGWWTSDQGHNRVARDGIGIGRRCCLARRRTKNPAKVAGGNDHRT